MRRTYSSSNKRKTKFHFDNTYWTETFDTPNFSGFFERKQKTKKFGILFRETSRMQKFKQDGVQNQRYLSVMKFIGTSSERRRKISVSVPTSQTKLLSPQRRGRRRSECGREAEIGSNPSMNSSSLSPTRATWIPKFGPRPELLQLRPSGGMQTKMRY